MTHKINLRKGEIIYSVDSKLYPLEMIRGAAFVFTDRAHILLKNRDKKNIDVHIKLKESDNDGNQVLEKKLKYLAGEFNNELLNQAFRKDLGERNKNIREYIVSQALFGASPESVDQKSQQETDEELDKLLEKELKALEEEEKKAKRKDPNKILVPWKKKFKQGSRVKKEARKKK